MPPSEGPGLVGPPANHCPVPCRSLTLWSLTFLSATLEFALDRPDSEGGVLQRVAKIVCV